MQKLWRYSSFFEKFTQSIYINTFLRNMYKFYVIYNGELYHFHLSLTNDNRVRFNVVISLSCSYVYINITNLNTISSNNINFISINVIDCYGINQFFVDEGLKKVWTFIKLTRLESQKTPWPWHKITHCMRWTYRLRPREAASQREEWWHLQFWFLVWAERVWRRLVQEIRVPSITHPFMATNSSFFESNHPLILSVFGVYI